jgi:hypothetical protein
MAKKTKTNNKFKLYLHPKFGRVYGEPVALPPTRIAWPYLVEPKEGGQSEDGQTFNDRYEGIALYDKKDKAFKKVSKHISSMAEEMVALYNKGKKTKVAGFEIGTDGDEFDHEKYPYYKGKIILTLRNSQQPTIVGTKRDKDGHPIKIDPVLVEGGCLCSFVVTPHFAANGGLAFKVNVVQLVEDDGTRFGGSINPNVYAGLLDYDEEYENGPEEEDDDDDEEEEEEDDDDEEEEEEDDDDEEEEEEEEDDEEDDDDDDDDDEEEEEEKPKKKRGRGRPATRKKAVDVL